MTDPKNEMLEDLFAQARRVDPPVSDDLMARVLGDAAAAQTTAPQWRTSPGLWARILDVIGGWPAAGGLVAATVAGVWLGVSPPAAMDEFAAGLTGDAVTVSLFSDTGFFDLGESIDG